MAARSARSWNFSKYFWLFQWEKIIFCQNAYFCLKMIFRPCYFYFFFRTLRVGWVGFEKCGKFRPFFFFFETFPKGRVQKKVRNFPHFSKPTHPTHKVRKKNKNNMVWKSFLSKNKYFGKKSFFPIEKVQNTSHSSHLDLRNILSVRPHPPYEKKTSCF